MGDGDAVSVTREIAAPAEQVWALVSDVTRMGEWSPENDGAKWLKGATEARPGAKFRGVNRRGKRTWSTLATVVDAEPGRSFSFRVTAQGLKVADWTYGFEPTSGGCLVTESWTDQRGRIVSTVGKWLTGVDDRAAHNRAGMEQTLERLAATAESNSAAP
jgi:uncharacterized protein YndB with AHSA1/START domain